MKTLVTNFYEIFGDEQRLSIVNSVSAIKQRWPNILPDVNRNTSRNSPYWRTFIYTHNILFWKAKKKYQQLWTVVRCEILLRTTPNIQQIGNRRYRGVKEKEFDQESGLK